MNLFGLIPFADDPNAVGAAFTHDRVLVAGSMLIGVVVGFVYLEMTERGRRRRGATAATWTILAGALLGAGVFQTHFIGMMALETPLKHGFVFWPNALSALVAVASGAVAASVTAASPAWRNCFIGGATLAMGGMIMHYLGMRGVEIEADLSYRAWVVLATALTASIGVSLAFRAQHRITAGWLRVVASLPMGVATAGLHYVDVAATVLTPRPAFAPPQATGDANLAIAFIGGSLALAGLGLAACIVDRVLDMRRAARQAAAAEGDVVVIPHPKPPADDAATIVFLDRDRMRRGG